MWIGNTNRCCLETNWDFLKRNKINSLAKFSSLRLIHNLDNPNYPIKMDCLPKADTIIFAKPTAIDV